MESNFYALHGFLGSSSDWLAVNHEWKGVCLDEHLSPFWEFAKSFNQSIKTCNNHLAGYSLGGRLALHALIESPSLWKSAVIISANPGLAGIEKEMRLQNDRKLAAQFLHEPWDQLLNDWNRQELFGGKLVDRQERDFDRKKVAWMLTEWSLGNQEDLREKIKRLPMPILWVVGQNDEKFCRIASTLSFQNPRSEVWVCPESYHRVPFENRDALCKKITSWQGFVQ